MAIALSLDQLMLRMAGEAGVSDGHHSRMLLQPLANNEGILLMLLHPDLESLQRPEQRQCRDCVGKTDMNSPVDKIAVKWTWHWTNGVLKEAESVMQIWTVGAGGSHDDVSVTIHVLGQAVHHNVSTKLQGTLEVGGQEGVVHNQEDVGVLLGNGSHGLDVDHLEGGVGGGLHPDHLGVGSDGGLNVAGVGGVHKCRLNVHSGRNFSEISVGATIHIIHGDDVVPGVEEMGDGGRGGQATGEHTGVLGSVQRCNTSLKNISGGVATPPILVLLEVCRSVLLEGGGHGDGRHHGHVGPLLGLLTNMESLGGKMLIILSEAGHDC